MKKKECPSCAMEIPEDAEVCPVCGYEFPGRNKYFTLVIVLMIILIVLYFII